MEGERGLRLCRPLTEEKEEESPLVLNLSSCGYDSGGLILGKRPAAAATPTFLFLARSPEETQRVSERSGVDRVEWSGVAAFKRFLM